MTDIDELDDEIAGTIRKSEKRKEEASPLQRSPTGLQTIATIDSELSDSRFAVLPEGRDLRGWSIEDKKELNDHVRHMLHSRRSRFRRQMRGFGQYVRRRKPPSLTPIGASLICGIALGFLVTLYASLITIFGLAWVLFLIGTYISAPVRPIS
jgi:hypothetical protein